MTVYKKLLHALGTGAVNFSTPPTIKALFVDSSYVPDGSDTGDEFYDDITPTDILLEETMSGVTWVNRVLDCADFVVSDPGGATVADHVVFCIWTGDGATSRLISFENITDLTFDGTDDDATINASGIFRLGGA